MIGNVKNITKIMCSKYSTMFISILNERQKYYACGYNIKGNLGLNICKRQGHEIQKVFIPTFEDLQDNHRDIIKVNEIYADVLSHKFILYGISFKE